MKTDAEHQPDDADLGEFLHEALVGDEPGRVGTDEGAGDQVSDEWGAWGGWRELRGRRPEQAPQRSLG
jgi:hypothetical protein